MQTIVFHFTELFPSTTIASFGNVVTFLYLLTKSVLLTNWETTQVKPPSSTFSTDDNRVGMDLYCTNLHYPFNFEMTLLMIFWIFNKGWFINDSVGLIKLR